MNRRPSLLVVARDGLVVPELVRLAGVPQQTFSAWVSAGEWQEWDNHVYGQRGLTRTFERRALAATMACGDSAVASHLTAAFLQDLFGVTRPKRIEVTVPYDELRRPKTAVLHRSRHLTEDDRGGEVAGVPVTSVARTISDIAPRHAAQQLEQIVMDAVRRDLVTADQLTLLVDRLGRTRAGSKKLRRIIERLHPDSTRLRSHLEVAAYPVISATRLPGLRIGFRILDANGRVLVEVDFAYPDVKLAIEIDGLRWHSTRQQKESDDRRQNQLVEMGWTVLRFSLADIRDRPESVVARIVAVHRRLSTGGPVSA